MRNFNGHPMGIWYLHVACVHSGGGREFIWYKRSINAKRSVGKEHEEDACASGGGGDDSRKGCHEMIQCPDMSLC